MREFDYITFKVTEYDGTIRAMTKQELKDKIIDLRDDRKHLDNFYSKKYKNLKIWFYAMIVFYVLVAVLMLVRNI